ncbi:MOSC domain-containing protein [Streptomyces sp. TRM 70351]|uniref:MOSC domain-containing protein n=1 Tax=Streptomyces sp. TRM 70351 TaxID=3116552 RepID=UPI002E7BCC4C|nr:MOSC domain-containing protein [Streptomyces sp. TRM 70351]MEE1928027.1 MOSC domain-containing protein [Streptomyces sp. TRM 70351]
MRVISVNVASLRHSEHTGAPHGMTGIGKQPADGPVAVAAPGPKGVGGSGLAGDAIGDMRHHGGDSQAVYAFAREDLDGWERELGRPLPHGSFGENLTTSGVAVNDALIGERWRIGDTVVLEVCTVRVPCRTFAGHLEQRGWVRRFTREARPGAYLRVIEPGEIRAGDAVEIVRRPAHDVSVSLMFRALTTERELLPRLLAAGDVLPPEEREIASRYPA